MSGWQLVQGRQTQRQLKQLASALAPLFGQQRPRRERKPEWMCGVCGTLNFLDRTNCRNCGTAHSTPAKGGGGQGGGKGGSKGGGKGNATRPNFGATVAAARAAGATEETVERLKQDAAQAKQEKQTLGARLDAASARARRAEEQLRKCEDAVQQAVERQEKATKEVEAAQRELAALKETAAAGTANYDADGGSVVAEARALLEVLENSPLYSTASNRVVPERLLVHMRKLRQTLVEHGDEDEVEAVDAEVADHLDTADELEDRPPLRLARTVEARKARSASPTAARVHSRTPPPTSRRNG